MADILFENVSVNSGPPTQNTDYYTYIEIDNEYLYANFSGSRHNINLNHVKNTSKVIFYPSKTIFGDYFLEVYKENNDTPLNENKTIPYVLDLSKYPNCRICCDYWINQYRACWRIYPNDTSQKKVTITYNNETIKYGDITLPLNVVYNGATRSFDQEATYQALCKDKKMLTDLKIDRYNLKCANKRMLTNVGITIESVADAKKFFSLFTYAYEREFHTDGTTWQDWVWDHSDEFIEYGNYAYYQPGDAPRPIYELDDYGVFTNKKVRLDEQIIPFGWYGVKSD